jgi:hypothetical protein
MSEQYPHIVIVQFRTMNTEQPFSISDEELKWRTDTQATISKLLDAAGIGIEDEAQIGGGAMEMFFEVADPAKGVQAIKQILTDMEYIGFCKIVTPILDKNGEQGLGYFVHYPEGALFNMGKWIPNPY